MAFTLPNRWQTLPTGELEVLLERITQDLGDDSTEWDLVSEQIDLRESEEVFAPDPRDVADGLDLPSYAT